MKRTFMSVLMMGAALAGSTSFAQPALSGDCYWGKQSAPQQQTMPLGSLKSLDSPVLQSASASGVQLRDMPLFDANDGTVDMFAFTMYDLRCRSNSAFVKFNSAYPFDYKKVYDIFGNTQRLIGSGTFVGDQLYVHSGASFQGFFTFPCTFGKIDPSTGEYTFVADAPTVFINDLAYDELNGVLYASSYNHQVTKDSETRLTEVYTVDLNTFQVTKVLRLTDECFYMVAIDRGYLYGLAPTKDGMRTNLYRLKLSDITPQTGAGGEVLPDVRCPYENLSPNGIGVKLGNVWSDMAFDKTSHRLFWICQEDKGESSKASFIELNPTNGKMMFKKSFTTDPQMVGLSIPYQQVNDSVPAAVSKLTVTPAAAGANSATLSWVNPTKNNLKGELKTLQGVRIYRDGKEVAHLTDEASVKVGTPCSFVDTEVPSGTHHYRVQTYSDKGDGVYKEAAAFVGRDVPASVMNLHVDAQGSHATVTWTAPQRGKNGGWFDDSSLTYRVERLPEHKVLAEAQTATEISDDVDTYAGHVYQITASNADGRGETVRSEAVAFGPSLSLPYLCPLTTREQFESFTVIDANADGTTWVHSDAGHTLYRFCSNAADDYLVSPKVRFETGKSYTVTYNYDDAHYVDAEHNRIDERLSVYYGAEPTVQSLRTLIGQDLEIHNITGMPLSGKHRFEATADGGYIAFHACSAPERGDLYVSNVTIREYSTTDLAAGKMQGSANVNCNIPQRFSLGVVNEGSAEATGYSVQLLDATSGQVIGQTEGGAVAADSTLFVPVEWTPSEQGEMLLTARILFDGDTYPLDNLSADTLSVTVNAEDAEPVLVVNRADRPDGRIPFYFGRRYSQIQSIFLAEEFQKDNLSLTSMQLMYNSELGSERTFKVRLSVSPTQEKCFVPDDAWNVYLLEGDWTVLYEGDLTLAGEGTEQRVTLPFDAPYNYTGGNLVFKFERPFDANNEKVTSLSWWVTDLERKDDFSGHRSANYRTDSRTDADFIDDTTTGHLNSVPYVGFGYRTASGIGQLHLQNGLSIRQEGHTLHFGRECQQVDVFDVNGRLLQQAAGVSQLSLPSPLSGVYVVRAVVDGSVRTAKIWLGE